MKSNKKPLTQAEIIQELALETGIPKSRVKDLMQVLATSAARELKKGSGSFVIPELGVKLSMQRVAARKSRQGRNPATGESITIKAKPAHNKAKARVLKKMNDRLGL